MTRWQFQPTGILTHLSSRPLTTEEIVWMSERILIVPLDIKFVWFHSQREFSGGFHTYDLHRFKVGVNPLTLDFLPQIEFDHSGKQVIILRASQFANIDCDAKKFKKFLGRSMDKALDRIFGPTH